MKGFVYQGMLAELVVNKCSMNNSKQTINHTC